MPDIVIDVPFAYDILETIKNKAEKMDSFPEELLKHLPTRFVCQKKIILKFIKLNL